MPSPAKPLLAIISQVYVPDPTAVGQHVADVAEEMAARGYDVVAYTSASGYDDPSIRYPRSETRAGVRVRRLPLSSFGKRSIAVRLVAQWLFLAQAFARAVFLPRLAGVVVSTSPPFAGFVGAVLAMIRRVPLVWWPMDINPDQMVAAGMLGPTSLPVRVFDWMNRFTLRRAKAVITLDRYMADRLVAKHDVADRIAIIPPWPRHDEPAAAAGLGREFRAAHGLLDRFVVMYSGNHALQHPVTTLLDAAALFADDPRFAFVFVGGGAGKREVERRAAAGAANVLSLPYQPLETLAESLAAADLHAVSMGNDVVGIVHPSKIYGAMAVGRPILFLGPGASHGGELVGSERVGWVISHGDVAAAANAVRAAAGMSDCDRAEFGSRAASVIRSRYARAALRGELCDRIEAAIGGAKRCRSRC
jgi:colanic acid biosynthesis glycosyl transferase WcaI